MVCRNKQNLKKWLDSRCSQKVAQTGFGDGFDVTEEGENLEIRDSKPTILKPIDKGLGRWSSQTQASGPKLNHQHACEKPYVYLGFQHWTIPET